MIVYDVATKVLDTETSPHNKIASLISGITFIDLFSQEGTLQRKEINTHARTRAHTHTHTHTHMSSVIAQFPQIPSKEKSKLIKFDKVDFYPSITEEPFMKSLIYAKSVETIDEKVVEVIRQSRKSLLFDHNNA